MPRRAILSTLFVLIGTLSGSAASLNPATRNARVLKPAQARIPGSEQRLAKFNVQRITPVWQAPAESKRSPAVFSRPGGAVLRPAAIKAMGDN